MESSTASEFRLNNIHSRGVPKTCFPSSKLKTYAFILVIIVSIGGFAVCGVGVAGYCHVGVLSNITQINAIYMMIFGGAWGATLFIIGIIGSVKSRKTMHRLHLPGENLDKERIAFTTRAATGKIRDGKQFGKAEWEKYFGKVGKVPERPKEIDEILNGLCPFAQDGKTLLGETHMAVLIPATVNGKALTLNSLEKLIQNPCKGSPTTYRLYGDNTKKQHGDKTVNQSYWVLMTRDVVPGTRNKFYDDQIALVNQYPEYTVPNTLEFAICSSVEQVCSGHQLLKKTYTRCSEINSYGFRFMAGNIDSDKLSIYDAPDFRDPVYGVVALRRFYE